ncbi:MAG TPA: DNA polymerase III subunit gamma/tau, partial [Candidatus Binatia bacterium]|nr:DNA polymerase III subunit gamma/tau [Candidatus Binatia bacterium]
MSYLVLARKWRPQKFEDIAGQGHIIRTLQNAIRANRIAHAYLFTGVRGVGKTTAARILAKALNCEQGPTLNPCNSCSQCQEITNGNSIDVLEIDGASNRGIDEVRQIIDNARYQPAKSRFKIYIIDEVHQVTKDAFNALLKTLEEPPPFVKFILATTEPHRLPETILSRCQRYDFRRIPMREIVQRLGEISKQEGLQITEAALLLLAREADGSMRDAQSLLEQALAYADPAGGASRAEPIDERLLHDVLGVAERQLLYELSGAVVAGNAKRCIELIGDVIVQGRDLCRLSRDLVEHFRNLLVARLYQEEASHVSLAHPKGISEGELLDLTDQEIGELSAQVSNLST